METHLDRAIKFQWSEKYKNLYQWCLQEYSPDGKSLGSEVIPWVWTLWFAAKKIEHSHQCEGRIATPTETAAASNSETINIELEPLDNDRRYPPTYSMFGTNRSVKDFRLIVYKLNDDTTAETCSAWGIVSYTAELDFRNETVDDVIGFELHLKSENFSAVRRAALDNNGEYRIVFFARRVHGFYAPWSPGISSDSIKVLTAYDEQKVDLPEGVSAIPRMGRVEEFRITVSRQSKPAPPSIERSEKDDREPDPGGKENLRPLENSPSAVEDVRRVESAIASLRRPMWLIFFALLALLFLRVS